MIKLKEFIQRAKAFINENPQRKKLLFIIFILAIIPLTVLAALTVQDLRQRAGGGSGIQILNASGNFISTTSDTNVRLRVALPENWVSLGMETNKQNFIKQAYAQTSSCSPPYQGFLGCFGSSDHPSGSVCTSSCTTDDGQSGQWCYTSTRVGSSCTSSTVQSGVCNEQGTCVASAVSTPTPTSPPIIVGNCGNKNCSSNQTCVGSSFDSSTFCLTKGVGGLGSYCGTPNKTPNSEACSTGFCDSTLRCANQSQTTTPIPQTCPYTCASSNTELPNAGAGYTNLNIYGNNQEKTYTCPLNNGQPQYCWRPGSGPQPTSTPVPPTTAPTSGNIPTPTPIPQLINALRIENKDTDGSYGGSDPISITSNFNSYISPALISWKLNDLLPEQNQATRIVQVTLFSNTGNSITLSASITLVRAPVSHTVISPMPSKAPPPVTWTVGSTFDLNGDRSVNCKDAEILVGQYGQKGTNLSADLNHDGIVDGIDYNTLVRNYTPGDTTVCN